MSTNNTVGLAFKEAAMQAEAELDATESSTETVISDAEPESVLEVEQPAVESQEGVFDGLLGNDAEDNKPQGELFEVKVDGETLLVTLDEALKGYMRQSHYTQGRQELAEREREAEKALTLVRLLEERPVETIKRLYREINTNGRVNLSETAPAVQEPAPAVELEKLVEERVNAILANDPRLALIQQENAFDQVEAVFSEIEEMYSVKLTDSDKQQTLEKAVELDTDDLKFVFGGLMHKAQQAKLAAANVKAAATAKPQSIESDAVVPATPKKYDSFRSALREAWAAEQGPETISAL